MEVLMVIALLGILAAIILPNFTGLTGHGQTEGAKAEKIIVQTAVDVLMAKEGISTITNPVSSPGTSDMSAFPSSSNSSQQLYSNYMRLQTAKGTYSCDATGLVTQESSGY